MKKSIAISVAAAIAALGLGHLYLQRLESEVSGGERVAIIVAAEDIAIGELLKKDQLAIREIPQAYVEDRHVRAKDQKDIVGARASAALKANESVLWTDVGTFGQRSRVLSGLVQNGMRAIAVDGSVTDFDGLLRPGDHVDVLLSTAGDDVAGALTVTLLQNLLVLSSGGDLGREDTRNAKRTRGGLVTLSATAEQAQLITQAKDRGRLSLTLRNPADIEIIEKLPETADKDVVAAKDRIDWRRARSSKQEEAIEHVR